jgi:hypothetical protein
VQADADMVWANDIDTRNASTICDNLQQFLNDKNPQMKHFPALHQPTLQLHSQHSISNSNSMALHAEFASDQSPAALFYSPPEEEMAPTSRESQVQSARISHVEGAYLWCICHVCACGTCASCEQRDAFRRNFFAGDYQACAALHALTGIVGACMLT